MLLVESCDKVKCAGGILEISKTGKAICWTELKKANYLFSPVPLSLFSSFPLYLFRFLLYTSLSYPFSVSFTIISLSCFSHAEED